MAGLDKLVNGNDTIAGQPYQVAANLPPAPQLNMPTGRALALDRVDKAAEQLKSVGGKKLPAAPQLILAPKG